MTVSKVNIIVVIRSIHPKMTYIVSFEGSE